VVAQGPEKLMNPCINQTVSYRYSFGGSTLLGPLFIYFHVLMKFSRAYIKLRKNNAHHEAKSILRADSRSTSQQILQPFCKLTVRYRIQNGPPLAPLLSPLNVINILPLKFIKNLL
jgi:hypothetical protein